MRIRAKSWQRRFFIAARRRFRPRRRAREAMRLLAGGEVDVLVTDLAMPEEDGYALLRAIRETSSTAEMPAIAAR